MAAVTSAGCAHLYLNLEGREPGGVVAPAQAMDLLLRAARALSELEVDGRMVVERIANRQEAAALGLGHANSGDLVVFVHPGFTCSSALDGDLISPSRSYSQHGYLNHHPEMHGFFAARGTAVKPGKSERMSALDVAPTVARLMGINFP